MERARGAFGAGQREPGASGAVGKAIKTILTVVIIFAVAFVGIGLALPSGYHVERSISINAERTRIHALVGDLKRWPEWAPWQEDDPSIRITYGSATTGVGAHQSWKGNSGSGALTFTDSSPEGGIRYDLSLDDGAFRCVAAMAYTPEPDATRVTWSLRGDVGLNVIGRYFAIMMDGMVGPDFERGLQKLKQRSEQGG